VNQRCARCRRPLTEDERFYYEIHCEACERIFMDAMDGCRTAPCQSRGGSAIEVCVNTVTGMVGSWVIAYFCMKLIPDRATAAAVTVAGCTVWSLVRGYCIRRYFTRTEYA
jgi:hypothetical protein